MGNIENGYAIMKGSTQFWILIVCSSAVCLLMLKEIFLSRSIITQQHVLVDRREVADSDSGYEAAANKLALMIYKASLQDPAMTDLLKSENVSVHVGPPPGAAPATNAAPMSPAASKPQTAPPAAGSEHP
jgi:hypothetical protein